MKNTIHSTFRSICAVAVLCISSLTSMGNAATKSDDFYLKDKDCVVFYGDSITDQRLYTTFVETYVATRFPAMNVTFIHSGWGGDRVTGGAGGPVDTRLERDVYAYNPTVMTIMLGMNDGSRGVFDQKVFDTYKNGLAHIVDRTRKELPNIRLTLIQPSPYDDVTRDLKIPGGYNENLIRYGAAVKEIAEANHQNVADLNAPVVAMLQKAKTADAEQAKGIIADRVHPGAAGHLVMAAALLKSWHAPSIVTKVAIDAAGRKFDQTVNTQASGLNIPTGTANLTWTQLDAALPMPVERDKTQTPLVLKCSDFDAELNQQILRVTGLALPSYQLLIDGKVIGTFPAKTLAEGLNLAMFATPMVEQAALVHKLTLARADVRNMRWRTFQVPFASAIGVVKERLTDALKSLDAADTAAASMQHAARQPVPHRYELRGTTAASSAPIPTAAAGN